MESKEENKKEEPKDNIQENKDTIQYRKENSYTISLFYTVL